MSNALRLSWSLLQWAEVIHLLDQFNLRYCREQTVQEGRAVWSSWERTPFEID